LADFGGALQASVLPEDMPEISVNAVDGSIGVASALNRPFGREHI